MCEEYFNCKVCGQKVSFDTGSQCLKGGLCRATLWDD